MVASVDQVLTATETVNDTTLAISVPVAIPVGAYIFLATNRNVSGSQQNGVVSIGGAGANVWDIEAAASQRAGAHDLGLHVLEVTALIAAASTLTVTWASTTSRKVAVALVVTGLDAGGVDATSGGTPGLANVSAGQHGNSATSTATSGAVSDDWSLAVAAHSLSGGGTATCSGTEVAEAQTSAGSTDRGVVLQYLELDAAGTRALAASYAGTTGWAAAIVTVPITGDPPDDDPLPAVWVDDDETPATTATVWLDEEEVPVVSIGVWIDGDELPLT